MLAFVINTCVYSQWSQQSNPTTEELYTIHFVNHSTAYIAGSNGTILKSTNAGENWESQVSNTSLPLMDVGFINLNTGYLIGGNIQQAGYPGIILKTTNGGLNWIAKHSANGTAFRQGLHFINPNTGFAAGWSNNTVPAYKTTNAGENWTPVTINNIYGIDNFCFVDENIGWAVGWGLTPPMLYVLKTTDGGENWNINNTFTQYGEFFSICFVNSNTGWIAGHNHNPWRSLILKTTNGGFEWFEQFHNHSMTTVILYNMYFANENTGWMVGDAGIIIKTTNAGENWRAQQNPYLGNGGLWSVHFFGIDTGWTVSETGRVLHTVNGGGPVAVKSVSSIMPDGYKLEQNYPNPFNPVTNIKFSIPENVLVTLKIFDLLGKEIAVLLNEKLSSGTYEITFDGSNLSSGVYLYQLAAGSYKETNRMILIK